MRHEADGRLAPSPAFSGPERRTTWEFGHDKSPSRVPNGGAATAGEPYEDQDNCRRSPRNETPRLDGGVRTFLLPKLAVSVGSRLLPRGPFVVQRLRECCSVKCFLVDERSPVYVVQRSNAAPSSRCLLFLDVSSLKLGGATSAAIFFPTPLRSGDGCARPAGGAPRRC